MEGLETFVPLMKKSKGFAELKKDVIDQDLCSVCGTCAAFCERVEWKDSGPEATGECDLDIGAIKCNIDGVCYDHCPHVSYSIPELEKEVFGTEREDQEIGCYKKIVAGRSKDKKILEKAQDGGVVTSLLLCAIESGMVEGASIATRGEDWTTDSVVAKTKEDLTGGAGTKYARAPSVVNFGKSLRIVKKLAAVGTGCQMTGTRRLQTTLLKDLPGIELLNIGLFCFENFPYDGLKETTEAEFNTKMEDIIKTDITKGKFIITTKDGKTAEKSVKVFNKHVPEACLLCTNFTSFFSDISVGSVGSDDGWSTVIIRSERGEELFNKAVEGGYIEVKDKVDLEQVKKNTNLKQKKLEATSKKRKEEGKIIPNYA
ncbi:MAG: Coenzyme F420 hydrogenase/dehydrogenase, beta subunit C-terminal domain [Candidatus Hydrothermarchaeales archaeon]